MRPFILLLLFALAAGGCAQTRTIKTPIYEDRRLEVTLHRVVGPDSIPLEKGYSHPVDFKVEDLKYFLRSIRYREKTLFGWSDAKRVFSAAELYRMTPHLVDAFAKAEPDDEVVFRSDAAKSGTLFSSERLTGGRMFLRNGKLNCIFGNINANPQAPDIFEGDPRKVYAGALSELVTNDWQNLVAGERGTHYNWIELDWKRALAEQMQKERALRMRIERRRSIERMRRRETEDWMNWQPDEAFEPEIDR
ncbi:MAG: hypothetical protein HQ583_07660 [Candidatus Abyssubacteria bacterium]|nr:hypothetical protein [Candidatus Abyssubacteria bacterium]